MEVSGDLGDKTGKEAEVYQKVTPIPTRRLPCPQTLVRKTKYGKYPRFITILIKLSFNVPFVESLEKMPGYAKFMNEVVTKKRSVSFEDDDRK